MNSYIFFANSDKPSSETYNSRAAIHPSNVSKPCLEKALELGYHVYYGVNRRNPEELECDLPVELYDEHTYRSIFALRDNWIAYQNLARIIQNHNVTVIHCNTPVGGMIGRLCGKRYGVKKVIYTAHGFHFYRGAPLLNRVVYQLAERIMARWTDAIITMNQEDFEAAKKFRLKKGGKVFFVHGVGITLSDFASTKAHRKEKRHSLGLSDNEIALISAGDLVDRKNYEVSIRAIALCSNPRIHYFICGRGEREAQLKQLAFNLGVQDHVHFLGFRTDVKELMAACDIFLFTTRQEGMPRSMMEAMASGLPCIASRIRGNVDLIQDGKNGLLYRPDDVQGFSEGIRTLADDPDLRKTMSDNNLIKIQNYSDIRVSQEVSAIYDEILTEQ